MSTKKWRLVEDEETSEFYANCSTLHQQTLTLIRRLRSLLTQLQVLHEAKKVATSRRSSFTADDHDVDVQALDHAVEMLQIVVGSFKEMTARKVPVPSETQEIPVSKNSSRQDSHSTSSQSRGSSRRRPSVRVSTAMFVYKNTHWREILWQGRTILCYLAHQLVAGTLAYCSNVSEQNHGQRALANIFRLSELYNDLLALSAQDNIGVATSCRNTCPVLLHPLRKLSITKLLQVLAQKRAEECCQHLVSILLNSFHGVSFLDHFPEEATSPEHTDNSSLEVYRALTRNMTPPGTTSGSVLPPVEKSTPCPKAMSQLDAESIEQLQRVEEGHVTTLLCVAAVAAPQLLGRNGVKESRSTGSMKVSKQVRTKVVEYYQQVLWGEVGTFTEHVLLWWGTSSMGTESPDSCQQLRDWLHNLRVTGRVPPLVVPAVQSLMDALCCHVTSTSWDQLFRLTLVCGRHSQHSRPAVGDGVQGTKTGQLYARLLRSIVLLCNQCETNAEWLSGPPIEELPLVEQIPVLHRLDHTVHSARLWATSTSRGLISAWSVDLFFMVSQSDVGQCIQQLQLLQLANHTDVDLKEVTSEHVMVCVKMRSKLVSEVRENIDKLKNVPEECIAGMASVCRTVSLANLHMCFPEPKYWRQSRALPKYASAYVEEYMDRVLRPVLAALGPLPLPVQQTVGGMVMRIMCEAWLDHIYMHRIKFSEWGALQLLTDFGAVPTWLNERVMLSNELQTALVKNEVLRRCEGVGRLLLRRPGEPINMSSPIKPLVSDSPGRSDPAPADQMPAEMYVPNQEQWLELRAPRNKGLCAISLCCNS